MYHYTADELKNESMVNILHPVTISQRDKNILCKQDIDTNRPGSILRDFEIFLHMIGSEGIKVSDKTQQLTSQNLAELNSRLTNPIVIDLKRSRQKSYSNIHGLYLILRSSGLGLVQQGKRGQRLLTSSSSEIQHIVQYIHYPLQTR